MNYDINVAYATYTKKMVSIERPRTTEIFGCPVLVVNEGGGKETICNLTFVHHYDVKPSSNVRSNKNGKV